MSIAHFERRTRISQLFSSTGNCTIEHHEIFKQAKRLEQTSPSRMHYWRDCAYLAVGLLWRRVSHCNSFSRSMILHDKIRQSAGNPSLWTVDGWVTGAYNPFSAFFKTFQLTTLSAPSNHRRRRQRKNNNWQPGKNPNDRKRHCR